MRDRDWIGGYSNNGDGSVTWHVNHGGHTIPNRTPYPEDPPMTTRSTSPSKPKHGVIRGALIVAVLLLGMFIVRGYLLAHSTPDSALAASGSLDITAMATVVGLVATTALIGKLLRRGK